MPLLRGGGGIGEWVRGKSGEGDSANPIANLYSLCQHFGRIICGPGLHKAQHQVGSMQKYFAMALCALVRRGGEGGGGWGRRR